MRIMPTRKAPLDQPPKKPTQIEQAKFEFRLAVARATVAEAERRKIANLHIKSGKWNRARELTLAELELATIELEDCPGPVFKAEMPHKNRTIGIPII
jgi:hypothetical protein